MQIIDYRNIILRKIYTSELTNVRKVNSNATITIKSKIDASLKNRIQSNANTSIANANILEIDANRVCKSE
jgi:hypothetical protein